MTQDNITDLMATVGELASSFVVVARCLRLLAHPLPLIVPFLFCLRNMRYCNASLRCSGDDWAAVLGSSTSQS